jgi:pyruvate/2-oxoglutarate dehydrogenase complex dihydrolipoamide acyltransferase (E2) component
MRIPEAVRMADDGGAPVWARSRRHGGGGVLGFVITVLALTGVGVIGLAVHDHSFAKAGGRIDGWLCAAAGKLHLPCAKKAEAAAPAATVAAATAPAAAPAAAAPAAPAATAVAAPAKPAVEVAPAAKAKVAAKVAAKK